jgi:hypothetical protein
MFLSPRDPPRDDRCRRPPPPPRPAGEGGIAGTRSGWLEFTRPTTVSPRPPRSAARCAVLTGEYFERLRLRVAEARRDGSWIFRGPRPAPSSSAPNGRCLFTSWGSSRLPPLPPWCGSGSLPPSLFLSDKPSPRSPWGALIVASREGEGVGHHSPATSGSSAGLRDQGRREYFSPIFNLTRLPPGGAALETSLPTPRSTT